MNIHVNLFFCFLCGSVLFTEGFLHNYMNYKEGYLYFFFPGFDALETLGQDDRGAAAEDRLELLFVNPADSLVRVNPALRLSEADRCAADRFGDVLFFVLSARAASYSGSVR